MLKHLEITDPHSCLNSAADDEPVFTLRAHDPLAAEVVGFWVYLSEVNNQHLGRLEEARALAEAMKAWRAAHGDAE